MVGPKGLSFHVYLYDQRLLHLLRPHHLSLSLCSQQHELQERTRPASKLEDDREEKMRAAARGLASILLVAFLLFSSSFARPLSTATQGKKAYCLVSSYLLFTPVYMSITTKALIRLCFLNLS